jgi:glutathione synthase/RimK-type ligase-like ATP-grasp enzyme
MAKIIALTDYKGLFGSKHDSIPYRSGMDKELLKKHFSRYDFEIEFMPFSKINFRENDYKEKIIIYTSQEDPGYYYKNYIEDIVYGLEQCGAVVLPSYKFLRANNNKVFMEILRDSLLKDNAIHSHYYGTLSEILNEMDKLKFPLVIKSFAGAMGTGVFLAKKKTDLIKIIKKISGVSKIKEVLKEKLRTIKYKGYIPDTNYRYKFVIQNFIPDLENDWKVYVMGEKYYVFYRPVFKKRGFRASGGGYDNYFYGMQAKVPDGIFDYARGIFNLLNVPNASLDIISKNEKFYLLEFQCVYFGTAGILKKYSNEYFMFKNSNWVAENNEGDIEKVYAESIVSYIEKNILV